MTCDDITITASFKASDRSATDVEMYNRFEKEEPMPRFKHRGRYCWGGMPLWELIIIALFIVICVVVAIMVPVLFITVGSAVAQSGVENTIITIDSQSIVYWGQNYQESCSASGVCPMNATETDNSPTCTGTAQLVPNMLIMNQTLTFSNVPLEGTLQAGQYQFWYTLENEGNSTTPPTNESAVILIGDLMVPQLSLHGVKDGSVTIEDIPMTLTIQDPSFFSTFAAIKIAPGGKGLWLRQSGNSIIEVDIVGTRMYYHVTVATWMFATNLLQCDGPLSAIPSMSTGCPCKNTCISWP
ncbi:hypothetical protein SARC_03271 [Sphaeroforma arctica JP610]|uniref:Uncharacterized protein n=1 Tax=Sphaeroforma arctica JP610 TaxID=667725 RepID=A0A0L0G656_9EUKA|nr:hypothetical protein SARC_03271 [Sphaeroforma arctica JP610]KNC84497.1 hypothetical protein SARC_03271 [Sphaeroforma arctica JP610]|eukprot:XP_014158399.1 hypothetical protein SARC_03271 [Sphaeroforma arctica JP610]